MIQLNTNYTLASSLLTQKIDEDTLLLDTQTQCFYELNSSAIILFEIMQKHTNLQDVYDEMFHAFEVPKKQLLHDMEIFISNLQEQNMISL